MTASEAPAGTADAVDRAAVVRTLSDLLPRFTRMAQAHKSQLASEGRDRAALLLLFPLNRLGPLRQSALAEQVHADPSTISRHVAALVDKGLVRRMADESDGRASRLVITDAGHSAIQGLCTERENHLGQVMSGWTAEELASFTRLFARLIDDLEIGLTCTAADSDPHASVPPSPRRTR